MRLPALSLIGLAAALSLACRGMTEPAPAGRFDVTESVVLGGGLVQTIRVENGFEWDAKGDWISITSRIRNAGTAPVAFTQRELCYLELRDLDTDIRLESAADMSCVAARPAVVTLAPDESSDQLTVVAINQSGPGSYRVRVRQVVNPEFWGEIQVTIPPASRGDGSPVVPPRP